MPYRLSSLGNNPNDRASKQAGVAYVKLIGARACTRLACLYAVGRSKEMVGTTRFELATSPTPRVRSTRLSHVPT